MGPRFCGSEAIYHIATWKKGDVSTLTLFLLVAIKDIGETIELVGLQQHLLQP